MVNTQLSELTQKAKQIRCSIIELLSEAQSGHAAGALGIADVFTALYFSHLSHRPEDSNWPDRDRVFLSNGHICPVLYATLAEAGYFPKEELFTFRKINSRLQGHPHRGEPPGVENSSGPLGQGLSQACGVALGLRMDKKPQQVYALLSDAEHQEGQTWEAYMLAGHYKLNKLTVLIDRNQIQIEGNTDQIMDIEPLQEKLESFHWTVLQIEGHNFAQIIDALQQADHHAQPTAIICHTVPGKGVSFMENDYHWHGKVLTKALAQQALTELD